VIRRLRAAKKEPERVLNLNALVREVARMHSDALIRWITVRLDLPATPSCARTASRSSIVLNFVLNALEATAGAGRPPDGGGANAEGSAGGAARGGGRGTDSATPRPGLRALLHDEARGDGDGASIARSIVVAHGGTISATNNPVRGATFLHPPLAADKPA
jgi:signal transduction histidine kinase